MRANDPKKEEGGTLTHPSTLLSALTPLCKQQEAAGCPGRHPHLPPLNEEGTKMTMLLGGGGLDAGVT